MNDAPSTHQEVVDAEQLRLLSIFHYIFGGLHALLATILIFHFIFGILITVAPHLFGHGHNQAPPALVGVAISAFSGCFMLLGWVFGALTIYSGVCMKRRQHRTFSLVIAVLNCLSIPFGTVLGIFTIVVLSRESVRRLYAEPEPPVVSPAP